MARRPRRNHSPAFKAKVALAAIQGERIMREIRRRTRVVGAFPDGQSALNPAAARVRHIAGTKWSSKRYMNMDLLKQRDRGA